MKKTIFAVFLSLTTITGFALHTDGTLGRGEPQLGMFFMYETPEHQPTPACAYSVTLTIDKADLSGRIAFLTDFIDGQCDEYIDPNHRYYKIKVVSRSCGSVYYEGSRSNLEGTHKIKIADHRTRVCRDIKPARVIIDEETPSMTRKLYSHKPKYTIHN